MTDKEKILAKINSLLSEMNYEPFTDEFFGRTVILKELKSYIDSLQEEPVSEELEEAADNFVKSYTKGGTKQSWLKEGYMAGAKWQKEHLWKSADGDDLPEIDREVIALECIVDPTATNCLCGCRVVFAHRPNPDGWNGKSITTGNVEHYTPKTYGKGDWNIPNIKYFLDVELPKETEL